MQIFVELAPACKKSARAAHHLQHSDDFFEPCAPTGKVELETTDRCFSIIIIVRVRDGATFSLLRGCYAIGRAEHKHIIGSAEALPILCVSDFCE